MEDLLRLVFVSLAAYRMARMVCFERGLFDCFKRLRDCLEEKYEHLDWVRVGVRCPLCVGFWLAILFALLPTWMVLPIAAAGAQVLIQNSRGA
jgi:hypothetical protein